MKHNLIFEITCKISFYGPRSFHDSGHRYSKVEKEATADQWYNEDPAQQHNWLVVTPEAEH